MISIASALQRNRDLARRRLQPGSDEGIALLSAILFMIVMSGLAVVLLSVIMAQLVPAATAQKRTQTVNAAEAGLEAALGAIRSSLKPADSAGKVYGNIARLPCALTGKVDGATTAVTYTASVRYFTSDPADQTEIWLNTNKMACSTSTGLAAQPLYALITSKGDGGAIRGVTAVNAGNRSISAIYQFKVSSVNIPGGRIYDSTSRFCLEARSAKAQAKIKFVTDANCTDDALQMWSHGDDYQIKLTSTVSSTDPGLCITGPIKNKDDDDKDKAKEEKDDDEKDDDDKDDDDEKDAKLQPCLAKTDPERWNQLWSWTGDYSWRGQSENIAAGPSSYCLSPGSSDGSDFAGKKMKVRSGCLGTFLPMASVGAGAAGIASKQIVNYKEFGRCADVTNQDPNWPYMITYPCKQDPTGTGTFLTWNHKWYYTEPVAPATSSGAQDIYVLYENDPAQKYCLQTPVTTSGSVYPIFVACDAASVRQDWKRVTDNGSYATSWLFVDTYGRCMTADPTTLFNGYSRITALPCNGTTAQKWNAPAINSEFGVGGYRESAP